MLFTGWEARVGKNCARGLEYDLYGYVIAVRRGIGTDKC